MLLRLTIRDFVLVDTLELEFGAGFGTLTGETGAGKSILIDALSFVLGERADSGLVRSGAERTEVSAEFDLSDLAETRQRLIDQDIDTSEGLLLRRVLDVNGRSRAYLNGTPVNLQQLREFTGELLDIHGQHAHQSLLRGDAQRALVDAFGGHQALLDEVGQCWRNWQRTQAQWQSALAGGAALAREREQLEWEVGELEELCPGADEWQAINEEQRLLAHAANLVEGAEFAVQGLADGESPCAATLAAIAQRLEDLAAFDGRLAAVSSLLRSAEAEVVEATAELRRYATRVDLDPARLAEVDRRIDVVLACARKFRVGPQDLPALLVDRRRRLAEIAAGSDPASLERAAAEAHREYCRAAERLTAGRRRTAVHLAAEVGERMQELALGGSAFEIALMPIDGGSAAGDERIEYRVGGLAGSESRPLAKVVSGGELSRISLAIQVVVSQAARVPTLVFDEVDVGIGGGVAEVVGRLLKALGERRQVLCVTHLPQVAAQADWQWRVVKSVDGSVYRSRVEVLDAAGRIEEIARMLGGVEITQLTRQHAMEMLAAA